MSASMVLRIQTPSGDGRNDADIVDYFIYFTVHGSACTFIIKSAYLRDLEWQSTRSQNCVLMSASMVLRIQTPSGDGRNDADHCCELSIFSLREIFNSTVAISLHRRWTCLLFVGCQGLLAVIIRFGVRKIF